MNTLAEENYLKAIYRLSEPSSEGVSTNDIAASMETKASSVTDMLKKLADKKLIYYQKYKGVKLTENGKKIALKIIRKHRLWEVFLLEKLRFKWDEVHDIAEQLEHVVSPELTDRLDEFLEFPEYDPHGDPIPNSNGKLPQPHNIRLSELPQGGKGIVSSVTDSSPSFLKYLDKLGVKLGTAVSLVEKHEFDDSTDIKVGGKRQIHVSSEVARNILISQK